MISGLVSVIVPVYKVEEYLDRCIDSIVHQTYESLEIILVDDGSPDRCPEICDAWAERDNRIKVIHKCNGGVSSARNSGLEIARGEYISFVDSDDYLDHDMIATLLRELEDPSVGIVECGLLEITAVSTCEYISHQTRQDAKTAVAHMLIWDGRVGTALWNKLFRSSVIGSQRFQEELRYGEDTPFLYEVLKKTDVYVQLPYIGYYHERRNESLVGNVFKPHKMGSYYAAKQVREKVKSEFPDLMRQASYHVTAVCNVLLVDLLKTPDGKKLYRDMYRELRAEIRNCDMSAVKQFANKKQQLFIFMLRTCPVLLQWLLVIRNKLK